MDRKQFEEILASLDKMSLPELQELANLLLTRIAGVETAQERANRELLEAWQTHWYTLTIVSFKDTGIRRGELAKRMIALLHCKIADVTNILSSLPYEIVSHIGEYPPYCMEKYRPLKEALEALGFVLEENYHYGHYA